MSSTVDNEPKRPKLWSLGEIAISTAMVHGMAISGGLIVALIGSTLILHLFGLL